MKARLEYKRDALIAAVGPSVWAKLGPEDWFDNYIIVAANSRDFTPDFVVDLGLSQGDLHEFTTQAIVDTPRFSEVVHSRLGKYRFVVYQPVHAPEGMPQYRFITNPISYKKYEDKRTFRDIFGRLLPIPEYVIVSAEEFLRTDAARNYEQYAGRFGTKFVVQESTSGGGRGTFIVSSADEMDMTSNTIRNEYRKGTDLVISRFVSGSELSIQVFVSPDHTIRGPLQQQLVRNPALLNPEGRGGMYFCGGKIITDIDADIDQQVERVVMTIADKLRSDGYSGIFGIDFMIDNDKHLYAIEINARTTGLLPLLNEMKSSAPLYLLHILEVAGQPYVFEAGDEPVYDWNSCPQSFVVLFNTTGHMAHFDDTIKTGNYTFKGGTLKQIDDWPRWHKDADIMIQLFASDLFPAKANLKLCNVFLKDDGFDDTGTLRPEASEIVEYLKRHIVD